MDIQLFYIPFTVQIQRFYRHALICSSLSHANIVPFLGVFSSNKFPYACVFESTGKENLVRHLVNSPGASRLKLVRTHISFCCRIPVLTSCYALGASAGGSFSRPPSYPRPEYCPRQHQRGMDVPFSMAALYSL
jgi:serine/threonine protein kinase